MFKKAWLTVDKDTWDLASHFEDFQFEILIDFDPSSDAWDGLTAKQQARQGFFASLVKQIDESSPDHLEGGCSYGYFMELQRQVFRRLMPYNFIDGVPLASFAAGQKPGGELQPLETFVVSLSVSVIVAIGLHLIV